MTYIMVDVESDGPIPGDYSMVCLGAIVVEPALDRKFYGRLKPISDNWIPEALRGQWVQQRRDADLRRSQGCDAAICRLGGRGGRRKADVRLG